MQLRGQAFLCAIVFNTEQHLILVTLVKHCRFLTFRRRNVTLNCVKIQDIGAVKIGIHRVTNCVVPDHRPVLQAPDPKVLR